MQMSSSDLAIQAKNLSKCYNIYNKPADRLKQSIVPKVLGAIGKPLRTYYREFWALRNLSLDIKKGETVGIIGRNGSGKSTLLQIISGILTPTSGSIETNGRITALLELGSGFNPEFTGRENVFLNGAILGLSNAEIEARFDAITQFADIGDFIEQPVKFYSSGMTVRLAFAVQAMVDPDILIVDEALAVGDERFQRKCFNRLNELKQNGTSILFVSHSMQQVIELCDRVLLLEQGEQVLFAEPQTTVRAYQKIIFATPDDQARMVQEFKQLDADAFNRVNLLVTHLDKDTPLPSEAEADNNNDIPETDFFENELLPQTTEFHPIRGAKINSIKIYTQAGREVNNLFAGHEYDFVLSGEFLQDFEAINIKILIHTPNGFPIFGIVYPGSKKYINNIKSRQKFRFTNKIKMDLLPEIYFVTVSIWSTSDQTPLHRVVDMIMFRVLPKADIRAFGHVDLTCGKPEFQINE